MIATWATETVCAAHTPLNVCVVCKVVRCIAGEMRFVMKTEMNGLVLRVAGGGRRNTDSRQTKAFQAPACVASSVREMFQPAVRVAVRRLSGVARMCDETKEREERKKVIWIEKGTWKGGNGVSFRTKKGMREVEIEMQNEINGLG
jgi:hypothetical protein